MSISCALPGGGLRIAPDRLPEPPEAAAPAGAGPAEAVLAGGCFWCTEAVFARLDGVLSVEPGYAGDTASNANYDAVCSGRTRHAEAIRIRFDPERIGFGQLLKVFFAVAHDPTQRDRQGNDIGPQYRSAIFPRDAAQQALAAAYIAQLQQAGVFDGPIATTIEPGQDFHPAEAHHHGYARRNPHQPYIQHVSQPKVEKLLRYFAERVPKEPG